MSRLSAQDQPAPDLRPFVRASRENVTLAATYTHALEAWVQDQITQAIDPNAVPLRALQAMGTHPVVYLAEQTITGLIRRPNLYYVSHPDKRLVKETEEWLWPILPKVLGVAARAFAYGAVPVIFNWGTEDLRVQVPRDDPPGVRNRTLRDHVHYVSAHEVSPGEVELEVEDDVLRSIRFEGRAYHADRAHLFCWDAEFGAWTGQGARRRAWRDYCKSMVVSLLQSRYLERSVDSPRVAWAPPGTQKVEGEEVPNIRHVNQLLMALRGSGAVTFPSTRDAAGNKRYELEVLDLPDRKDVWHQALNRYDGGILKAYLVPPSLAGLEDLAAAGARILDGMLREFIQDLATFAASNLTELVATVHAMNHDPARVPAPEILAYEVPAAVRKLYLEVLRLIGAAGREEAPADWVDVPSLLDQLGVPLRTAPVTAREQRERPAGRPPDLTSGRQERREDARDPPSAPPDESSSG
ncbi:MAG TPA: hypothetical protein DEA08_06370 [Planctomycetes bacterium]|nr:hypothetical protein [Planctomycetota bacterium]